MVLWGRGVLGKMEIGELIREIRKQNKLTQAQLGDRIGVGGAAIRKYELGIRKPKFDTLEIIANALNVDPFIFYLSDISDDRAYDILNIIVDKLGGEIVENDVRVDIHITKGDL